MSKPFRSCLMEAGMLRTQKGATFVTEKVTLILIRVTIGLGVTVGAGLLIYVMRSVGGV